MKLSEHIDTAHQFICEELEERIDNVVPNGKDYVKAAREADRSMTEIRDISDALLDACVQAKRAISGGPMTLREVAATCVAAIDRANGVKNG